MIVNAKILRVLQLICALTQTWYTCAQMAALLDCSERTIMRYLQIMREVGFVLEVDRKRYRIKEWPHKFNPYEQQVFSLN